MPEGDVLKTRRAAAEIHRSMCQNVLVVMAMPWDAERWGGGTEWPVVTEIGDFAYETGAYDASSSAITAWRVALSDIASGALDGATWTGNMADEMLGSGLFARVNPAFQDIRVGDVLVRKSGNSAIVQPGGMLSGFAYDERGGGGGFVEPFFDDSWDFALRYVGDGASQPSAA